MGTLVTRIQPNALLVFATVRPQLRTCVLPAATLVAFVLGVSDSGSRPVRYKTPSVTICTGPNAFERLLKRPGWRVAAMSATYNGNFVCSWAYDVDTVQEACKEALEKCSQILQQRVPVWKDTCRIIRIFAPGVEQDVQDPKLSCKPPVS
jgi:hypothetical protein